MASQKEKQAARREYLRGDIDFLSAVQALVNLGEARDNASELVDRWQLTKKEIWKARKHV